MGNKTPQVIEHARSNGGIITTGEAQALGMNRSTLARKVEAGIFTRIGRGTFALAGADPVHELDLQAACRRLSGVVSHQSAGRMHQFEGLSWSAPTVTVPHRLTHEHPGVYVHQSTDICDDHIVEIRGLPVTNPERTVFDLAAVISERRLDWILDRAMSAGTVDLDRLGDLFASLARRGKPGTAKLRRILEGRGQRWAPPDSALENRLLRLIEEADLPIPTRQFHAPWLSPTNGRVDFAYPEQRLVIEGDSRRWHLLMKSFDVDRQRDNQAQLAGWRILRFTWEDITDRPVMVAGAIRSGLRS